MTKSRENISVLGKTLTRLYEIGEELVAVMLMMENGEVCSGKLSSTGPGEENEGAADTGSLTVTVTVAVTDGLKPSIATMFSP